jgi:hypothetical protein
VTGAKLALHRDDLFLWDMLDDHCRMFGIPFKKTPPLNQWLEHEEEIEVKGVKGRGSSYAWAHSRFHVFFV